MFIHLKIYSLSEWNANEKVILGTASEWYKFGKGRWVALLLGLQAAVPVYDSHALLALSTLVVELSVSLVGAVS